MTKFIIFLSFANILFLVYWQLSKRYPCPSIFAWMIERDNPLAKEHQAHKIVPRLNLKPGMTVADIGCGPGRVTVPIVEQLEIGRVVAVDLQEKMLTRLRQKAKNLSKLEIRNQDILENPLEKENYDRIVMVCLLGEVPKPKELLQSCSKSLKRWFSFLSQKVFLIHTLENSRK